MKNFGFETLGGLVNKVFGSAKIGTTNFQGVDWENVKVAGGRTWSRSSCQCGRKLQRRCAG